MRFLYLLYAAILITVLFSTCASQEESHSILTMKPSKVPYQSKPVLEAKTSIHVFHDAFKLDRVVPLSNVLGAIITDITDVVVLKDHIYILDKQQSKCLLFRLDGSFVKVFANTGSGPGELEYPSSMVRWGDGIAIANRGNIQVYSESEHLNTMRYRNESINANEILYLSPETMVVSGFTASQQKIPSSLFVLNHQIHGHQNIQVVHGFDTRPGINFLDDGSRNYQMPFWGEKSILFIHQRIWKSYSYSGKLRFFSNEGMKLTELDSGFDNAQASHFAHIRDRTEAFLALGKHYTGEQLVHAGPYVLANYRKQDWKANLFDVNGNLLKHDIETPGPILPYTRHTGGEYLAVVVPHDQLGWENALEMFLGKQDASQFEKANYDAKKHEDYNPWLVLYKPRIVSSSRNNHFRDPPTRKTL